MFKAENGRQYNLAAKTIRQFFSEQNVEVKHAQALELASRLTGFASYAAANAALQGQKGSSASDVRTWGDLAHALRSLDDEQLGLPIQVTDGSKGSDVALFAGALQLVRADDNDSIADVAGSFQRNQPILLIDELEVPQVGASGEKLASLDILRVRMQFEVATNESGLVAENCIAARGLDSGIEHLNKEFDLHINVGPYVLYSEQEQGFWNADFGWVYDKASATGFGRNNEWSLAGVEDAELVRYEVAVDVDPDVADMEKTAPFGEIKGRPVSRYQWQGRYQSIWEQLAPRIEASLTKVGQAVAELGYTASLNMNLGDDNCRATLDFTKEGGPFIGGITIVLIDGEVDYQMRAAALELFYESARGNTATIAEGSSPTTYYATEAQFFLNDTEWLNPEAILEMVTFQLNAEGYARNK